MCLNNTGPAETPCGRPVLIGTGHATLLEEAVAIDV